MQVKHLKLENFRNYQNIEVDFNEKTNIIFGKNGQGKTNLIEALYFLTHLRSFRSPKIKYLQTYHSQQSSLEAIINKYQVSHRSFISLVTGGKKIILDEKKLAYSSEYIKNFLSLLFAPDLLSFFKEHPVEKRNFFDRLLFLVEKQYFYLIKEFNRVKKQKNSLLRNRQSDQIIAWKKLLAEQIPKIINLRQNICEKINNYLSQFFFKLTGRNEKLYLNYGNDFENKIEISEIEILKFINSKLEQEKSKGHMDYGPHKDRFWMTLNEKDDKNNFSQGEYRISFIALILSVSAIVKEELNFSPVLLFDDIFSELDENICQRTLNCISENNSQVFITSTKLPEDFEISGSTFQIKNGTIQ